MDFKEFYNAIKSTEELLDNHNWKAPKKVFKHRSGAYTIHACIIVPGKGNTEYEEEWELSFDFSKGERASWDYPGHPDEVEFIDATLKTRTKFVGSEMEDMEADRFMYADEWFEYSKRPEEELRENALERVGQIKEAAQEAAQMRRRRRSCL